MTNLKELAAQAGGTEDRVKWISKLAVPDPSPDLRGAMSKHHSIQAILR